MQSRHQRAVGVRMSPRGFQTSQGRVQTSVAWAVDAVAVFLVDLDSELGKAMLVWKQGQKVIRCIDTDASSKAL